MKKTTRILAVSMALMTACSLASACRRKGGDADIDKTKSLLQVYCYDGGFGSDWAYKVKDRFEDKYKDVSLESGKTGVQVKITPSKSAVTADSIKGDKYSVYFVEGVEDYHILRNKGCFEDITSVVTSSSSYDSKKIEDKLTDVQKSYWGVQKDDGTHYYCLPHYEGYYGIVYNIDLFDKYGFYFARETGEEVSNGKFIMRGDDENKAYGPDGRTGIIDGIDYSLDDGLPATYEEFYELCNYIKNQSVTPLMWLGESGLWNQYITSLTHAMVADYEGAEQTMLNYTFNGTANDLGTIQDGQFVKDATPTQITGLNGYELARQQGKYEAIKFTDKISRTPSFHHPDVFSKNNQRVAESIFLKSSYGQGDGINDPCAMLVDGVWWENESQETFRTLVQANGDSASKMNRRFGWMYLPKANQAKVDEHGKNVLCDVLDSKCFVKAGLKGVTKQLALDFVQFANSDESLREFHTTTGAPKALQYSLTSSDLDLLSPYAKSLYAYRQSADIVYPISQNPIYINNASKFDRIDGLYNSKVGNTDYSTPVKGMHSNASLTAEQYFTGIYTVFSNMKIWQAI